MCENRNMEKKNDDLKVVHSQHVRILKEEDEIWISSEDLNTENSTDDEKSKTKQLYKKKLRSKHRKRSSPNINVQRPSIPSIPSTSGEIDERLLMPKRDEHLSKSDDSRTSDEEYAPPTISSECLSKRMSLEDWRPTRGSLTISSLEEATSTADTRKNTKKPSHFFDVMRQKLSSLKTCPASKSDLDENARKQEKPSEPKTLESLKETPEVRRQLNFIKKLDEEIKETIARYKDEREDRLRTEFEMCRTISEHSLAFERDTELFLEMCNFEQKLKEYKRQAEGNAPVFVEDGAGSLVSTEAMSDVSNQQVETDSENVRSIDESSSSLAEMDFIKRNIYAAKEGVMANFSLTDEQKTKIADILRDIEDYQLADADLVLSPQESTENMEENYGHQMSENIGSVLNGFAVSEQDKIRIMEINDELEKFQQDEMLTEKNTAVPPVIKDDEFWKKYILDHSLKDIDVKLEKLYASYAEDEEKLKTFNDDTNGDD